jgi:hypothetical protein
MNFRILDENATPPATLELVLSAPPAIGAGTREIVKRLTALLDDRKNAQQAEAGLLVDDKSDLDTVTKNLTNTRCKLDITNARISRLRDTALASFVADQRQAYVAASVAVATALNSWRSERESWRESCLENFPKPAAEKIASDAKLMPRRLHDSKLRYDESRTFALEAARILQSVDAEFRAKNVATPGLNGFPRAFSHAELLTNAGAFIPELRD